MYAMLVKVIRIVNMYPHPEECVSTWNTDQPWQGCCE